MNPADINQMGLADLVAAQRILSKHLEGLSAGLAQLRGYDYTEYERREKLYSEDFAHGKLNQVEGRIKHIIENLK